MQKEKIAVKNPGAHFCQLKDNRKLTLQSPTLTAAQFLNLLKPFLDPDVVVTRETEYRLTCSIFGPLADALDRSRLKPEDVDLCLQVGGSSLILPVQQAIAGNFPKARMLSYEDADAVQTSVARGGAYHALLLAVTGKGVLQPIAADAVSIQTDTGPVELIPAHVALPYPSEGKRWAELERLAVPCSSKTEAVDMRIELLDSLGTRLCSTVWQIPAPVRKGDPLTLRFRLDENQLLEMGLSLAGGKGSTFAFTVENPLTHVLNPTRARARIDELEEDLKNNRIPRAGWPDALIQLAILHEELNQLERAFDLWKKALRAQGTPTAYLLNRMGLVSNNQRDYEKAERFYREATALSRDGIPSFNLALSFQQRGRLKEAAAWIVDALAKERKPPYLVLQARLADSLKDTETRDAALAEATHLFGNVDMMTDKWEVWWYKDAATMRGDLKEAQRAARRLADLGAAPQSACEAPLPIDRGTNQ